MLPRRVRVAVEAGCFVLVRGAPPQPQVAPVYQMTLDVGGVCSHLGIGQSFTPMGENRLHRPQTDHVHDAKWPLITMRKAKANQPSSIYILLGTNPIGDQRLRSIQPWQQQGVDDVAILLLGAADGDHADLLGKPHHSFKYLWLCAWVAHDFADVGIPNSVSEMQRAEALRPASGVGKLTGQQRAGVAGEDRLGRCVRAEGPIGRLFDLYDFRHVLADQVAAVHGLGGVCGVHQPRQGRLCHLLRRGAAGQALPGARLRPLRFPPEVLLCEGLVHRLAAAEARALRVQHRHFEAPERRLKGDLGAERPRAHHRDLANGHSSLVAVDPPAKSFNFGKGLGEIYGFPKKAKV